MTELTRRRILSVTGAVGAVAVAGCSSSADEDDEEENGDDEEENGGEESGPRGTELGEIALENVDDEAHTIDVIVEIDEEIEHWSTHELTEGSGSNSGLSLERDWSTEPSNFRVTVRLDGDEFIQRTSDRWSEYPCINLMAFIDRSGDVLLLSASDGGACGSGDPDYDE